MVMGEILATTSTFLEINKKPTRISMRGFPEWVARGAPHRAFFFDTMGFPMRGTLCNTPFPERTQGAIGRSPAPLRPLVRNRRSADGSPRNREEATYEW